MGFSLHILQEIQCLIQQANKNSTTGCAKKTAENVIKHLCKLQSYAIVSNLIKCETADSIRNSFQLNKKTSMTKKG